MDAQPERRSTDHLALGVELAELRGEVHAIRLDLADVKDRIKAPRVGVVAGVMGTVAAVLLSIGGLSLRPIYQAQIDMGAALKDIGVGMARHFEDGHPGSVRRDIGRIFELVQGEHDEQGDDIEQLRATQTAVGHRNDIQDSRLMRLETQIVERALRFKEMVGSSASDRWTGSQQKEYQRRIEDRLKKLEGIE